MSPQNLEPNLWCLYYHSHHAELSWERRRCLPVLSSDTINVNNGPNCFSNHYSRCTTEIFSLLCTQTLVSQWMSCKHALCEVSTNLMSPPHHQVGENSDPQDGADKRHGKIPPGRLENTKDISGYVNIWKQRFGSRWKHVKLMCMSVITSVHSGYTFSASAPPHNFSNMKKYTGCILEIPKAKIS